MPSRREPLRGPRGRRAARGFSPGLGGLTLEGRALLSVGPGWGREQAARFYLEVFQALDDPPPQWEGDAAGGVAGVLGEDYQRAILRRVNAYRAMAGAPAITTIDPYWSHLAQQAAMLMSANQSLSHYPGPEWKYFSADAARGAANSNLALGSYGSQAVDGFIEDPGPSNVAAGHRWWLLNPNLTRVGIGDVPRTTGRDVWSQAIYVDMEASGPPSQTLVAWPPSGAFPISMVPGRWSFADYGNEVWLDPANSTWTRAYDYSQALVQATVDGVPQPVVVEHRGFGFGNDLVFTGITLPQRGGADVVATVTIRNVLVRGVPQTFTYSTTFFSTEVLDSLYLDLGAEGVWRHNAVEGSRQVTAADPEAMVLGKDGTLYLDFGAYGLWSYGHFDGFRQLNAANPQAMEADSDGALYIDYGPYGLWRATLAGGFRKINDADPQALKAGAYGQLFVDYGPYGLWRVAGGRFEQLNAADPESMEASRDGRLYVDFGRYGLWAWDGSGIRLLNAADPVGIATGDHGDLAVDFGPWGVWVSPGGQGLVATTIKNPRSITFGEFRSLYFDLGPEGLRTAFMGDLARGEAGLSPISGMDPWAVYLGPSLVVRSKSRRGGLLDRHPVLYIGYAGRGLWRLDEFRSDRLHLVDARDPQAVAAP